MRHTEGTFILEKWLEHSPCPVRDVETFSSFDLAKAEYYSHRASSKSPLVSYAVVRVDADGIRELVLPDLLDKWSW